MYFAAGSDARAAATPDLAGGPGGAAEPGLLTTAGFDDINRMLRTMVNSARQRRMGKSVTSDLADARSGMSRFESGSRARSRPSRQQTQRQNRPSAPDSASSALIGRRP
ncbi:hypothetical protein [Dactylosporangium salmoneum]